MKRIPAFTLAEVIIVLIISMILLSTIFTILYIVNRQNASFNKNIITTNEFLLAEKLIKDDIYAADSVKRMKEEDAIRCYVKSDSISYFLGTGFFERTAINSIDSFNINISVLLENYIEGTDLIEQISLQMNNQEDSLIIVIQKNYDAVSAWQSTQYRNERN